MSQQLTPSKIQHDTNEVHPFQELSDTGRGGAALRSRVQTSLANHADALEVLSEDINRVQLLNYRDELRATRDPETGKVVSDDRQHAGANAAALDGLVKMNQLNELFQQAMKEFGPNSFDTKLFDVKFTYVYDDKKQLSELNAGKEDIYDIVKAELRKGKAANEKDANGNYVNPPTAEFSVPAPDLTYGVRRNLIERATKLQDPLVELQTLSEHRAEVKEHLKQIAPEIEARDKAPLEDVKAEINALNTKLFKQTNLDNTNLVANTNQLLAERDKSPKEIKEGLSTLADTNASAQFNLHDKPKFVEKPITAQVREERQEQAIKNAKTIKLQSGGALARATRRVVPQTEQTTDASAANQTQATKEAGVGLA